MEQNEIKKALYREKPLAIFVSADKATLTYTCFIKEVYQLYFCIPHSDIGDAKFGTSMPAQQLIRWLVIPSKNTETLTQ